MLCHECRENIPLKEYWGLCLECWDKSCKEIEEENMKRWEVEAKKKGISLQKYIEEFVNKAILSDEEREDFKGGKNV